MLKILPPTLPPHPRLFFVPGRVAALRMQIEEDDVSGKMFRCVRHVADRFLQEPLCERIMEGRRLLAVSRLVLSRVLHLGLAALVSGEDRYAQRAIREMRAAAAFTDWNPSHYLDVAEMTLALGIGYDWLHGHLSEAERDTVAAAIIDKGLAPSLDPHAVPGWVNGRNNWNQVCHAGLTGGALAVAERDPARAEEIVSRAVAKVPLAAGAYAPDGAYVEGTMYWGYGTAFHVMLADMLEGVLGHDGGVTAALGFLASAHYILQATAPSGEFFNYADARAERPLEPPLFWFARRTDAPELLRVDLAALDCALASIEAKPAHEIARLFPLTLLWWQPKFAARLAAPPAARPRHWLARGPVPVGVHRSAWDDPAAVYVAVKGGCPASPHGHMDGGGFVLEGDGVRWAVDPGMQEYHSLEKHGLSLWGHRPEADRWKIFRVGPEAHNILRFNGAPQLVEGATPVVSFRADGDRPHTVLDLSALYADHAARVRRGVALGADGRVLLQDEWTAHAGEDLHVSWQMLTRASVTVAGRDIHLAQAGKHFHLRIEEPADATVEVLDVSAPAHFYDVPNRGLSKIVVRVRARAGSHGTLLITGTSAEAAASPRVLLLPLADWT